MAFWSNLKSMQLASPLLFLIVFISMTTVLLVVTVWKRSRANVKLADINNIKNIGARKAKINSVGVTICLILISLVTSLIVAGPKSVIENTEKFSTTDYFRVVVTVTDISGSMGSKITGFAQDEERDLSSIEVVIEAQIEFLSKAQNIIAGIVFFGTYGLTYRVPTTDIDTLVEDLKNLELVSSGDPGVSPLYKLNRGTVITRGLLEAEHMIDEIRKSSGNHEAILIIFSDMRVIGANSRENMEGLSEYIRELTDKGIRVFIVTDANESLINRYRETIGFENEKVEFFRAYSQQDIDRVLNEVAELPKTPIVEERTIRVEKSFVKDLSFLLAILLVIFILTFELYMRRARERR